MRVQDLFDSQLAMLVREGEYGGHGTPRVYYEDADTYRDVTDLYTVLDNQTPDGTVNLENAQVEQLATDMLTGKPLSAIQIGVLKMLLAKHAADIEALRAKAGKDGQDYTSAPDPGTAQLIDGGS